MQWTVNGQLRVGFFTTKAVTAGTELTFDYQFQRYGYRLPCNEFTSLQLKDENIIIELFISNVSCNDFSLNESSFTAKKHRNAFVERLAAGDSWVERTGLAFVQPEGR